MKILHIMPELNIYSSSFKDFIHKEFYDSSHEFFMIKKPKGKGIHILLCELINFLRLLNLIIIKKKISNSEKVILHGLFNVPLLITLFVFKNFREKSFWFIWGGDLYNFEVNKSIFFKIKEKMRKKIIGEMPAILTFNKGNYYLVKDKYNSFAKHYRAFYPFAIDFSKLDKFVSSKERSEQINILMGNSAACTNNHIKAIDLLKKFRKERIRIYTPLSYGGSKKYINDVRKKGNLIFNKKFIDLTIRLPPSKYFKLLSRINVAIFNHERPQGMGNILPLLYMGKKVFIRKEIVSWDLFKELGIKAYDTNSIDKLNFHEFVFLDTSIMKKNHNRIYEYFSNQRCIDEWKKIFKS